MVVLKKIPGCGQRQPAVSSPLLPRSQCIIISAKAGTYSIENLKYEFRGRLFRPGRLN